MPDFTTALMPNSQTPVRSSPPEMFPRAIRQPKQVCSVAKGSPGKRIFSMWKSSSVVGLALCLSVAATTCMAASDNGGNVGPQRVTGTQTGSPQVPIRQRGPAT